MEEVKALNKGIGLEDVSFAAFEALYDGLNYQLGVVQTERVPRDQKMAAMRNQEYQLVELERVESQNFFLGHVPSLILDETPVENYPVVSVMAYRADPDPSDSSNDQMSVYVDRLYTETIVKSSPKEGEEMCNRRIWRTCDAIHRVLSLNQDLNGSIFGLGTSPTVIISEVFTRSYSDTDDTDWFWQAGRIEYGVSKFSPFQ